VIELLRSNNPVLMSFAASLLREAGIEHAVADSHMSVIDGSIGALTARLLVVSGRHEQAHQLLSDAGVPPDVLR
jgi:hypothetical protein